MPPIRVDFYLLSEDKTNTRWLVACRLLEKAYTRGHRVYVHCETQADAYLLDELLWTYKDDSFIPHNLHGEGPDQPPAVQLGYGAEPRAFNDILLNLSHDVPAFAHQFSRILEIVADSETEKSNSREHYRIYRSRGYQLHTHRLSEETLLS